MKTLILCLSVFAVALSPSNAFLSGIIDSISGTINNTIDSFSNTINTVLLAGEFLWDNAIQPSLQVLQENGAEFIDNYFGNILNAIGKRSVDAIAVKSQRDFMSKLYLTQVSTFTAKLKELFVNFLKNAKNQIVSLLPSIISGETNIRDVLVDLIKQAKSKVSQLVQQAISNLTSSSRSFGIENLGTELGNIINQMGDLLLNQFNQAIASLLGQN